MRVATRVVTRSSYGNALYFSLSMFVEFGNGITKGYATFQTLQTWVGHDGTVYLNLNSLPQALPYIFYQFNIDRP